MVFAIPIASDCDLCCRSWSRTVADVESPERAMILALVKVKELPKNGSFLRAPSILLTTPSIPATTVHEHPHSDPESVTIAMLQTREGKKTINNSCCEKGLSLLAVVVCHKKQFKANGTICACVAFIGHHQIRKTMTARRIAKDCFLLEISFQHKFPR